MRKFSYSPLWLARSLVELTCNPSGRVLADGTVRGSFSRLLVEIPDERL